MASSSTARLTVCIAVGASLMLLMAGSARADIVYLTQSREVYANIQATGVTQSFTAPDFGPFDRTATVDYQFGRADANQDSTLGFSGITASGMASASRQQIAVLSSHSSLDLSFTVTQPAPFVLSGTWTTFIDTVSELVRLRENDSVVFESSGITLRGPFSASGTLRPGFIYRLEIAVYIQVGGLVISRDAQYNSSLSIPTPTTLPIFSCLVIKASQLRRR